MTKKIVLFGPECTGKTSLSIQLAKHYKTEYVPEFLRKYFEDKKGELATADTEVIMQGQRALEAKALATANDYLFCDTCPLTNFIYHKIYFGHPSQQATDIVEKSDYDFYLLLAPDLPWEADSQRDSAAHRDTRFTLFEEALIQRRLPFKLIFGLGERRLSMAIEEINRYFSFSSGQQ